MNSGADELPTFLQDPHALAALLQGLGHADAAALVRAGGKGAPLVPAEPRGIDAAWALPIMDAARCGKPSTAVTDVMTTTAAAAAATPRGEALHPVVRDALAVDVVRCAESIVANDDAWRGLVTATEAFLAVVQERAAESADAFFTAVGAVLRYVGADAVERALHADRTLADHVAHRWKTHVVARIAVLAWSTGSVLSPGGADDAATAALPLSVDAAAAREVRCHPQRYSTANAAALFEELCGPLALDPASGGGGSADSAGGCGDGSEFVAHDAALLASVVAALLQPALGAPSALVGSTVALTAGVAAAGTPTLLASLHETAGTLLVQVLLLGTVARRAESAATMGSADDYDACADPAHQSGSSALETLLRSLARQSVSAPAASNAATAASSSEDETTISATQFVATARAARTQSIATCWLPRAGASPSTSSGVPPASVVRAAHSDTSDGVSPVQIQFSSDEAAATRRQPSSPSVQADLTGGDEEEEAGSGESERVSDEGDSEEGDGVDACLRMGDAPTGEPQGVALIGSGATLRLLVSGQVSCRGGGSTTKMECIDVQSGHRAQGHPRPQPPQGGRCALAEVIRVGGDGGRVAATEFLVTVVDDALAAVGATASTTIEIARITSSGNFLTQLRVGIDSLLLHGAPTRSFSAARVEALAGVDTRLLPADVVGSVHGDWLRAPCETALRCAVESSAVAAGERPFMASPHHPVELLVSLSSGQVLRMRPHDGAVLHIVTLHPVSSHATVTPIKPVPKAQSPVVCVGLAVSAAARALVLIDSCANLTLLSVEYYGRGQAEAGNPAPHCVLDGDTNAVPGAGALHPRQFRWSPPEPRDVAGVGRGGRRRRGVPAVVLHRLSGGLATLCGGGGAAPAVAKRKRGDEQDGVAHAEMEASECAFGPRVLPAGTRAVLPLGILRHNHSRTVVQFAVSELQRGLRDNNHSLSGVTSGTVGDSTLLVLERLAAEHALSLTSIVLDTVHRGRFAVVGAIRHPSRLFAAAAVGGRAEDFVQQQQPAVMVPGVYVAIVLDLVFGLVARVIPLCPLDPRQLRSNDAMHGRHTAPSFVLPLAVAREPPGPRSCELAPGAAPDLVVVAGGLTDTVFMFSVATGELLARWRFAVPRTASAAAELRSLSGLDGMLVTAAQAAAGAASGGSGVAAAAATAAAGGSPSSLFDALVDDAHPFCIGGAARESVWGVFARCAEAASRSQPRRRHAAGACAGCFGDSTVTSDVDEGADDAQADRPSHAQQAPSENGVDNDADGDLGRGGALLEKPFGVVNGVDAVISRSRGGAVCCVTVAIALERGEVLIVDIGTSR